MRNFISNRLTGTAVVVLLLLFILNCNNKKDSKNTASSNPANPLENLYGNWLCDNLLDSVRERKSMLSIFDPLTLPYAYEIQFDESFNDSVLIYNGFEQYFLPVVIKKDSVILESAVQGNPLIMLYDSLSSTLKVMINRNDNYPIPSVYFKADQKYIQPNGRFKEAFNSAFNETTVEGNYTLLMDGQLSDTGIRFNKNGTLNGYKGGYRYQCCIGGDCLGMTTEPMNTMQILMHDKPEEDWAWYLSYNADTLTLTKIEPSNPHEPGTFRPTAPTMKLVRDK